MMVVDRLILFTCLGFGAYALAVATTAVLVDFQKLNDKKSTVACVVARSGTPSMTCTCKNATCEIGGISVEIQR